MLSLARRPRLLPATAVMLVLTTGLSACDSAPEPSDPATTQSAAATSSATSGTTMPNGLFFYPPVEGATLKYTNGGISPGSTEVVVESVASGSDGVTVTTQEVVKGSGTPVTVKRTFRTTTEGGMLIDATAFGAAAPGMQVTASGDDIAIPPISELESGATAKGTTYVELSGSGLTQRKDVTYAASGDGFSSVTVAAGTVKAYVVKLNLTFKTNLPGASSAQSTFWILPGFGLVRQEMVIAGMTLTTELSSSSVPLS